MAEHEPAEGDLPWLAETDDAGARTAAAPSTGARVAAVGIAAAALVGAWLVYQHWPQTPDPELAATVPDAVASPQPAPAAVASPVAERPKPMPSATPTPQPSATQAPPVAETERGEGLSRHRGEQAPPVAAGERGEGLSRQRAAQPTLEQSKPSPGASGGQTIQLASYPRRQSSERHWQRLLRSHPGLRNLDHRIEQASVRGRTVYRLRASGSGAHQLCGRLERAGVDCLKIGR